MSSILAVGIATLDIVNTLASYPREDEEVRALAQRRVRGGNATNTLVILSQLGYHCSWAGVLPREPDAQVVLDDLEKHRVDITAVQRPDCGKLPTSYISLSAETGSRSIVHYRDLPEYDFPAFDGLELDRQDWLHFEGRNVGELGRMLKKTSQAGIPCSLEVEKPREGIESLFDLPDVLLFSRVYVRQGGFQDAGDFLASRNWRQPVFLAWGAAGAWCRTADGEIRHVSAPDVAVVDSLGAGDVFNAAVIDGLVKKRPPEEILHHAVRLASAKCARQGLKI
ncbi:PfkB family carbohydrate kinase [Thiolapillus sp.]